jgi:hypothetical protein
VFFSITTIHDAPRPQQSALFTGVFNRSVTVKKNVLENVKYFIDIGMTT